MSIESRYAQSLRSRGVLCVCQNLGYYNSQFILVASDTILTLGLFMVDFDEIAHCPELLRRGSSRNNPSPVSGSTAP